MHIIVQSYKVRMKMDHLQNLLDYWRDMPCMMSRKLPPMK
nr:hypothetical protein Q903MT_gene2750 [Picea sitchensis]